MDKKVLYLLIGLICTALLGIIAVQFFWIRNAVRVKEEQFDQNVYDALGIAVNKLETQENIKYIGNNQAGDSIRRIFLSMLKEQELLSDLKVDSLLKVEEKKLPRPGPPAKSRIYTYNFNYNMNNPMPGVTIDTVWNNNGYFGEWPVFNDPDIFFQWNEEEFQRIDSMLNIQEMNLQKELQDYGIFNRFPDPQQMIIQYSVKPPKVRHGPPPPPPDPDHTILKEQVKKLNSKARKFQDVVKKMTLEMESKPRPIEDRIDKKALADILKKVLSDKDINRNYEFAVILPKEKKPLTPVKSDGFRPEYVSTKYKVSLFPNDIFQKQYALLVKFPGSGHKFLGYLSWLMIASILFTLIVVITSGLSIFVMIRQKKISDIKTDFINNMTHEFKTPIATISIAADSINNPKVIQHPEIIKNYTRVIKEENQRMNTRVEQVLQMALLDSSEFKLNEKILDLHDILRKLTDNIRLQTESRNGKLTVNLNAERSVVMADESHLTIVFISILDNAIKYSQENPDIQVSTKDKANGIVVSIEDHGIGMNSEIQKKIFDKFYRVTSGNIHNIKGFGLGLSYAKAIVLAHNGEIKVTSEAGQGSRFDVILPVITNELTN
jgi:two-component system, OmpR family, phosphate regulon sensor histidine kinase PhoR